MFELGNNLREARHRRQIDLVIAEQDTKIRSKYLAALETEDFDVLPGPVFVRGFLRTYSRYLGLDPQMFIDEYNARFGRFEDVEEHSSPALGRPSISQERSHRSRRSMRILVIASLVAIAAFAWLGLREDPPSATGGARPHVNKADSSAPREPATIDAPSSTKSTLSDAAASAGGGASRGTVAAGTATRSKPVGAPAAGDVASTTTTP